MIGMSKSADYNLTEIDSGKLKFEWPNMDIFLNFNFFTFYSYFKNNFLVGVGKIKLV